MSHIFIAGATGVVGRRVLPLLVARGHRVTAAVRSPHRVPLVESLGARALVADLFDPEAARGAVSGHEVAINLATHIPAMSRMMLPGAWRENDRVRRELSRNLADAVIATGAARFVQESFALVYPDGGDRWIDERTSLAPQRYNRSIVDAERSAERVTRAGRAGVVLRFAGFYGPDDMLRTSIAMVRRGWSPLPGRPEAYVSSISQDDAASAVVAALGAPAGVYNVVDDLPLPRRHFVRSLAAAVGAPPPRFAPAWTAWLLGGPGRLIARSLRLSNHRLRGATGWAPRWPGVLDAWPAVLKELGEEGAGHPGAPGRSLGPDLSAPG